MKTCSKCKETKPYSAFQKRNTKNGYRGQCKQCRNAVNRTYYDPTKRTEYHLRDAYGITLADYDRMLLAQGGECGNPACSRRPAEGQRLCIDHNHQTGVIRGLLCNGCNTAAGLAQDHPEVLRGLADYLEDKGYYG